MIEEKIEDKKIIPLTYDFMFKALFGNEKNIKILTRFLSDYFEIDYSLLEGKVRILNNELIKNDKQEKKKSVDVIIELNEKEILNLEMNANKDYPGLKERNTAYICKIYSEQHIVNDDYRKTKKCIQINFNNFSNINNKEEVVVYKLRDKENNVLTENLEIHNIDIEYINKMCYNKNTKKNLDKWTKILKTEKLSELKRSSEFMDNIGKELVDEVERLSSDEHIIGLYDGELHEKRVRNSIINDAIEKGTQQGIEQGIQQGIQQGIKQGVEQGVNQEKLNIAKKLISMNMRIEDISKATELSIEQINNIENC